MAAVDVITYVNEPKLKRTQLDPWGTISAMFCLNRPSSYCVWLSTDTQTDTRTTQVFSDPDDPNIPRSHSFSLTECKKATFYSMSILNLQEPPRAIGSGIVNYLFQLLSFSHFRK